MNRYLKNIYAYGKNSTIAIVAILLVGTLSSSCAVNKFKATELSFKDCVIRDYNVGDTSSIANIKWNQFYKDKYLLALIQEGLNNNYDLKNAILNIDKALAYFKKSKADFYPVLGANANAKSANNSYKEGGSLNQLYNMDLSLSWEIDIWGKIRNAKKGKFQDLLAEKSTKDAVTTQLIAQIAKTYYSLLSLDTQHKLVIETINNRETYYKTVKLLKESAQVNEVAVLQAEAQLYAVKAYLPNIRNAITVSENTLCMLLGRVPGPIERDSNKSITDLDFELPNTGIPASLLANRPDVLAAEHRVKNSIYNVNFAKASMYPALTIEASSGTTASNFNNWFSASSFLWNIAAGLSAPIFNGRALKTQKDVAIVQYQQAINNFKLSVINAGVEVSNALSNFNNYKELAICQYKQCSVLEKAYEFSIDLLISGYGTYLDVLAAQNGLFSAKLSFISSAQNYAEANIELYRALGGGWK